MIGHTVLFVYPECDRILIDEITNAFWILQENRSSWSAAVQPHFFCFFSQNI
jgi:hypothetical protein